MMKSVDIAIPAEMYKILQLYVDVRTLFIEILLVAHLPLRETMQ